MAANFKVFVVEFGEMPVEEVVVLVRYLRKVAEQVARVNHGGGRHG